MTSSQEDSIPNAQSGLVERVFHQLENYDFSADEEFQTGLRSILSSSSSPSETEHLTLRAQCFYLSRKLAVPVDFAAYKAWRERQGRSAALPNTRNLSNRGSNVVVESPTTQPELNDSQTNSAKEIEEEIAAPYPNSFSQIVELISGGKPIPGIKDIPSTILEGQASQPTAQKRRKPWENDHASSLPAQHLEETAHVSQKS